MRWSAVGGAVSLALVVMAGCSSSTATSTATTAVPPEPTIAATTSPPATAPASTIPPVTTSPVTTSPVTAPATCPTWSKAVVTGQAGNGLDEVSGLAAGRRNPNLLWTHNDSGDRARIFGIDQTGRVVTELAVPGATALDWEDIAVGPGPDGQPWIWVADTGDNFEIRREATLYRFPEPSAPPASGEAAGVERIDVRYPDGSTDVEALMVDPISGDALLVGKAPAADQTVPVFRLAATDLRDGAQLDVVPVARIVGRTDQRNGPTAADISADGTLVLVSNGREGFLWLRDPTLPVPDIMNQQPLARCRAPIGGGEAAAFAVDGRVLWSMSEGEGAALRRFART